MSIFKQEKRVEGVLQRDLDIQVAGENVPCVVWSPADARGPRTLILMGHGGSQHKKTLGIRTRAIAYAKRHGWATLAIDAPGHGDRISREEAAELVRVTGARVRGDADAPVFDPERLKQMVRRSQQAVPEWRAALDAAQALDFVGASHPVGYWGVSMGTAIGVPLLAEEPRVRCAVLGLAGLAADNRAMANAASRITIPLQFVFQWEDAVAPRDAGIALFNAFSSKAKTMHINPGGHMDVPDFESQAWEAFFLRHLVP